MNKTRTERQIEAFVRWVNDIISCRGLEIEEFPDDLKNGVILCHLAELLTNKKLKRFRSHPTLQAHEYDNLGVAFRLLTDNSLRLVNVGPDDVYKGNVKCILGLLWSCIQTYQLNSIQNHITSDPDNNTINDDNDKTNNTANSNPRMLFIYYLFINLFCMQRLLTFLHGPYF